jgi:dsDNA-binding SOS-regulon protein
LKAEIKRLEEEKERLYNIYNTKQDLKRQEEQSEKMEEISLFLSSSNNNDTHWTIFQTGQSHWSEVKFK